MVRLSSLVPAIARQRLLLVLLAIVMAVFLSSAARGQTFTWNDPAGGTFSDGTNWTPAGPPGAGQNANFNLNNTYTVSFNGSPTNANLTQSQGTVTFDLFDIVNRTYTLTGTAAIGNTSGQTATLTVGGGGGTLQINGSGSIGTVAGSTGTLRVIGTGSALTVSALKIGDAGTGTFNLLNGSTATTTGEVDVAAQLNSTGNVTLLSGAWNHSGGSIFIGGSSGGVGGIADVAVGSGGTLNVTGTGNGITFRDPGSMTIFANGTVNTPSLILHQGLRLQEGHLSMNGGTLNINGGTFLLGPLEHSWSNGGTINVNGGVWDFSQGGVAVGFLWNDSGNNSLNLLNGSTGTVDGNMLIGGDNRLTVQGGSSLTTQFGDQVGFSGGSGSAAQVIVSGAGSSWLADGGISVAGSGNATLHVENGGSVTTNSYDVAIGVSSPGVTGTVSVI
jgi:T5SS/PEP-CTERM-associated repeat protein